ncbi:unnamed protein product, partial [marine sediment metagenome]
GSEHGTTATRNRSASNNHCGYHVELFSSKNPASSLSGGNQQRLVLSKWLASNLKILILNGPTVGVDVGSKVAIHSLIRDLAKQGMGIILISDDIPELIWTCNRILLMRRGRIVEEFQREQTNEEELHEYLIANDKHSNTINREWALFLSQMIFLNLYGHATAYC